MRHPRAGVSSRCCVLGETNRVDFCRAPSHNPWTMRQARRARHCLNLPVLGSSQSRLFSTSQTTPSSNLEDQASSEIASPNAELTPIHIDLPLNPIHPTDESGRPPLLRMTDPVTTSAKKSDSRLATEFVRRAQKMCQEELYPVGSIVSSHLVVLQIKSILDALGSTSVTDDSETSVNAAMGLLERLSREPLAPSSSASLILSNLPPDYYNRILDKWKEAALRGDTVWSATIMTRFLLRNALPKSHHPGDPPTLVAPEPFAVPEANTWKFIQYDIATISMVMQVAAKQMPALSAPDEVQHIWNQLDVHKTFTKDSEVVYCYNALIKAWAESGSKDAAIKMESVWNEMINVQKVQPNVLSYHIFLKYYRQQSNLPAAEKVIQSMLASTNVRPTISCWNEIVICHLGQAMNTNTILRHQSLLSINKAQTILQLEMIPKLNRENSTDMAVVATCVQSLITTYRDVLLRYRFNTFLDLQKRSAPHKPGQLSIQEQMNQNNLAARAHDDARDRILESAEAFFRYMQGNKQALSGTSFRKCHGGLWPLVVSKIAHICIRKTSGDHDGYKRKCW